MGPGNDGIFPDTENILLKNLEEKCFSCLTGNPKFIIAIRMKQIIKNDISCGQQRVLCLSGGYPKGPGTGPF
jgi:hypothetical protein